MAGVPRSDEIFADLATALGFSTRLPVPFSADAGRSLSQSLWAAPLAGLAVALAGWLAFIVALWLGLFTDIAALFALGAILVVTGALHEDGLADIADGFGGGREREAKLAIMRDSRIGTYGVCALTISLIARWLALAALVTPGEALAGLIAAHMASRALLPAFMRLVPNARHDGLSAGAGEVDMRTVQIAALFGAMALLLLGLAGAVMAALALTLWFFALRRIAMRQIGGRTGDVLGALQQGGEIIVLVTACAMLA